MEGGIAAGGDFAEEGCAGIEREVYTGADADVEALAGEAVVWGKGEHSVAFPVGIAEEVGVEVDSGAAAA